MTTKTRERPITFSGTEVTAILAGRKTQFRRIIKPQPTHRLIEGVAHITKGMNPADDGRNWYDADCINPGKLVRCPLGRVGDSLWVRETFALVNIYGAQPSIEEASGRRGNVTIIYAADNAESPQHYDPDGKLVPMLQKPRWRPSTHMPRWASRLTLEITDVRVQRVQEIGKDGRTAADVMAEGITREQIERVQKFFHIDDAPALAFAELWDSANGPGAWERNDFCWCVTFKRVEQEESQ